MNISIPVSGSGELLAEALCLELLMIGVRVVGEWIDTDSSARHEIAGDLKILRIHQFDQIFHDDVHAILMKIAVVAEGEEVELEALALHHPLARDITDVQVSEIRLPGFGAEGGELRTIESHQIFVLRMLVRKSLQDLRGVVVAILRVLVA